MQNIRYKSPTEQLYKQMTSNPAFTKRNIQNANAYLLNGWAKLDGHVSRSTELVRMCLACQHFDSNSADWFSDNLHVSSSWYLRTMGKEFNHSFQHTLMHEAGTRDEPLRKSAWETTKQRRQSRVMQSHVTPADPLDPAPPCTSLLTWGSTADPLMMSWS